MAGSQVSMATPDHDVTSEYQQDYYDPTSQAALGGWVKRPSGEVGMTSGRLTGEDFPDAGL